MERSKSKKKRSVSHSGKKPCSTSQLHEKISKLYGAGQKPKIKNERKTKLILNPQKKARVDTSDYDFPEFSICFKEDARGEAIIENRVTFRKQTSNKNVNNLSKGNAKVIQQKSFKKLNQSKSKKIINASGRDLNQSIQQSETSFLKRQYRKAISKIYKALDIFNRGSISEININKWVPESALYFLGKVFQRIRTDRKTVTEKEFVQMCLPLMQEASQEQITWFIEQTAAQSHLKVSANLTEDHSKPTPIERRMLQEQMQKNILKFNSNKPTKLDQVLSMIKQKEENVCDKIREVKEKKKSVTFNILGEKQCNVPSQTGHSAKIQFPNDKNKLSMMSNVRQQVNPTQVTRSFLKNQNHFRQVQNILQIQKQKPQYPQDNPYVANFTFQLPQTETAQHKRQDYHSEKHRQIYSQYKAKLSDWEQSKLGRIQQHFPVKLNHSQVYNYQRPNSDRGGGYFQENRAEAKSQTYRLNVYEQNKRLDKLSNKLEDYIRLNASKIEKTKSFIREQSPIKLAHSPY